MEELPPTTRSELLLRVNEYVAAQADLDLLRFITCGSMDDGKSTLIGRMLYEAELIFDDQIAALRHESKRAGTQEGEMDLALLVDGLAAEREQGITIDVAYRFFSTDHRRFIVADTPGHEHYLRNMVTGASTAEVAVILVDASKGILTQTCRHSFIASLLGIRSVVLAVNKMDLVDFERSAYDAILTDYKAFAAKLDFDTVTPIPLCALDGDNVISRSSRTPWYSGPTLLGYLETVEVSRGRESGALRFPVQWVNRLNADFRGYAGTVTSGSVRPGDAVRVLPSGEVASIEEVVLYDHNLEQAVIDQAVTLTIDREIDISRGDVIVSANAPCGVSDQFEVSLVWMDAQEGYVGRSYWLVLGTSRVKAMVSDIKFRYNVNTLDQMLARALSMNDVGRVVIRCDRPVAYEPFKDCKGLGAFVLIDRYTHATVGAGMIDFALRRAQNLHRHVHSMDKAARATQKGQKGKVIWLTGLSGSGKSTVANALEKELYNQGRHTYILDGDNVRHGLNQDLGFTDADRVENIRRVAEVAKLMVDAGLIVITAFISPFKSERDMARSMLEQDEFVEIYVDVPLDVAEERDPKGLYRKARRGELPNFTGIDSPYEPPGKADLVIRTDLMDEAECVARIIECI